jgi:hypothetical protein
MKDLCYRDVIARLQTFPQNVKFGTVGDNEEERQFLRDLYTPLSRIFAPKSKTSAMNRDNILKIEKLEIPQSLCDRLPSLLDDPQTFWEGSSKELPKYLAKPEECRARYFFESIPQLAARIDEDTVLLRAYILRAHQLFMKCFPEIARIRKEKIDIFLKTFKLLNGDEDKEHSDKMIECYHDIIQQGRRQTDFCTQLVPGQVDNNSIYWPLFVEGIPKNL